MKTNYLLIALLVSLVSSITAAASEVALKSFSAENNSENLKHGAEVYINVCRLCHGLKYIKYSNLADVGFSQTEIDEIRGDTSASEKFKASMPDDIAETVFGAVPPDLSLMAKARKGGPAYIYSFVTGFYEKEGGGIDNHVFPSTKMPDALSYTVYTEGERKENIEQRARDISSFLNWTAEPFEQERHQLGYFVLGYLIFLTLLFWLVMKRVWSRLDKQ